MFSESSIHLATTKIQKSPKKSNQIKYYFFKKKMFQKITYQQDARVPLKLRKILIVHNTLLTLEKGH